MILPTKIVHTKKSLLGIGANVKDAVAKAVAEAARKSGVARI